LIQRKRRPKIPQKQQQPKLLAQKLIMIFFRKGVYLKKCGKKVDHQRRNGKATATAGERK
jgi:hypothetical protein